MKTNYPPGISVSNPEQVAGMLYMEAVTRYYPLFSAGAYIEPSTAGNRAAIQCLLEALPAVESATLEPEKKSTREKTGNILKLLTAALIIREELEAGFKIVEANAKTLGNPPKG